MNKKLSTKIVERESNGKEYGYKTYYMVDVIDEDGIQHFNYAEAKNESDIKNARKRALYNFKKDRNG